MRLMLDTCAFIDAVTDPDILGNDILALLEDYSNTLIISSETVREVILKYKVKKVWTKKWYSASDIIKFIKSETPFIIDYIHEEHLTTYANLLPNEAEDHKDPSDHLIIAHAITNGIPLISRDRKFGYYRNQGLELIYYGRQKL